MHSAPASTRPSSRWPTAPWVAGSATGSTKATGAAVDPATAWGLTTPAKGTTKPTTAMATSASAACSEHMVPTVMKTQPTTHNPT